MSLELLIIPVVTILGMMGGQGMLGKTPRRYGVPIASLLVAIKKKKYKSLFFVIWMVLLSMGYGIDSKLAKVFKKDWIVRIAYGLLLSVPLIALGSWYGIVALPLAFSIRAGGFKIWKYDWLWEDFIRYLTLGVLVWLIVR